MPTLIITEKTSQARDLRAALGDRYGEILPAEGHLLRLAEPHEVNAAWKNWSCELLQPEGLYPTRAANDGNKPAKLKAIAAALARCDQVILATDCDREGQLIGQEILEHLRFRGTVRRALFTAQDPKSLRQAFDKLTPNRELRPIYEAAVARQQADQIFNLSLTRTATRTLLARGVKGVIGIGRVKTPTLAIVCLREIEIRDFKVESYFEIVATAKVAGGTFTMRHAPPAKSRIANRAAADAIVKAATGFSGPIAVTVEHRRQAPPRLYDLPALQKTCGQRWGWTADKTLAVAQALYDGDGKKLITYPRAEARHLAENQIGDVPAIVSALTRLRGFAHIEIDPPVIRRGKSGHFCDKALEGVSHHAIAPNVNVMDDLEARISRLSDDEKRLFAMICRSYLAAVMPDFEYRQTVVTMKVPLPEQGAKAAAEFRASGRIPLKQGWKAAFGATEAEGPEKDKDKEADAEQTLPQLVDGEAASLSRPRVQAKETQPPPRYNEGTLVDAMQNAWRFIKDEALRERLKEAKGIGTPATRAEIIKGLKRQNFIAADGKLVVPTPAGLQLFELLRGAAPALVDPGTTAIWEMRLDDVVVGKADFRAVIDEIAGEALRMIKVLRQHTGKIVELEQAAPARGRGGKSRNGGRARPARAEPATDRPVKPRAKSRRPKAASNVAPKAGPMAGPMAGMTARAKTDRAPSRPAASVGQAVPPRIVKRPPAAVATRPRTTEPRSMTPTGRMIAYAEQLAKTKNAALPAGYNQNFDICMKFLDKYADY